MPTTLLLAAAARYIANGWPVFLLGRTKRPLANCRTCHDTTIDHNPAACPCLTCHGFYAATTDADRFAAMLRSAPYGLLAIRTGAISGLLVIDIDPRNGGRLDPALMAPTATVATGGGGWHLYYRHPATATGAKVTGAAGVDVKSDGGYVAAPPSRHPVTGWPYRWVGDRPVSEMPPPLIAACQRPPEPTVTRSLWPTPTQRAGGITSPDALLAAHLHAVATAPPGRRRTTLYGAARGVARMVAAGALTHAAAEAALTDAGVRVGQPARDIRAAIAGGFRDEGVAA